MNIHSDGFKIWTADLKDKRNNFKELRKVFVLEDLQVCLARFVMAFLNRTVGLACMLIAGYVNSFWH